MNRLINISVIEMCIDINGRRYLIYLWHLDFDQSVQNKGESTPKLRIFLPQYWQPQTC